MEKESIEERGMGVRYKGSQGQTKRTVELQEEEEEETIRIDSCTSSWNLNRTYTENIPHEVMLSQ
jgi:hypothetical protein